MLFSLNFSDWKLAIINVTLLLLIIIGTYRGYKNGFLQSTIKFIGVIASLICAYLFKNPVSVYMYTHLPFFKLTGALKGATVINILIYEIIAFVALFIIFLIVLDIICNVTGLISKILSVVAFIGLPNKILGAVVGFVESIIILYFVSYIFLFGCNFFNFTMEESLADAIVGIPILKNTFSNSLDAVNDIAILARDYGGSKDKQEFNYNSLDILLKYEVITPQNAKILVDKGKIDIEGIDGLIDKYK